MFRQLRQRPGLGSGEGRRRRGWPFYYFADTDSAAVMSESVLYASQR